MPRLSAAELLTYDELFLCAAEIAGIKEGLYDTETLASYLLYRMNVLDPVCEYPASCSPPTVECKNSDAVFLPLAFRSLSTLPFHGVTGII